MLNVFRPSPPVPQVSTRSAPRGRTGTTCARIARAQPTISSSVSPFIRSATSERRRSAPGRPRRASPAPSRSCVSSHREVVALDQRLDRLGDHAASPPWRGSSAISVARAGVSTDSGWNCTPCTAASRWRRPMTSPSGVAGGHDQHVGQRLDRRQRVVAAGLERVGRPARGGEPSWLDLVGLAVHEPAGAVDHAAVDLEDHLVAEAHAEDRHAARGALDQRRAETPASAGRARAGGDDQVGRRQRSASSAVTASLRSTRTSAPAVAM